jgi:CRISPR/Cas system-associated endonuclease/helicase Cas3
MNIGQMAEILSNLEKEQWIKIIETTDTYLNDSKLFNNQLKPKINNYYEPILDRNLIEETVEDVLPLLKKIFRDAYRYRSLPAEFMELFESNTNRLFHVKRNLLKASLSLEKIELIKELLYDKLKYIGTKDICIHCECVSDFKKLKNIVEN